MSDRDRHVVVIGGPNGAGKSTIARDVLSGTLGITEFVNADTIAAGLSGFSPERAAFAAGRVMLERLHELGEGDSNFAFESTLASRSFAPWLKTLIARGVSLHVVYVWLRSPELAIRRVKARVRRGGHGVDAGGVRRRYARSARDLVRLYLPLACEWAIYDNSGRKPRVIAQGWRGAEASIYDSREYDRLMEVADGGRS